MSYVPSQEEQTLVRGCLEGQPKAQKQLYETFYPNMLGVCLRYTRNQDEARDLLQEAFIKVFERLSEFKFGSPLGAWVRKVVVNTAIDRYRRNGKNPMGNSAELNDALELSSDTADAASQLNHQDMLAMLQKLPIGYQMVFNMYVIEGFSHKEIGEAMGISEGTSKSQLAKARASLQKMLTKSYSHHQ